MDPQNPDPTAMNNEGIVAPILNSLKIVAINVNSLIKLQRRYDLEQFIVRNNLDITLISEKKLNFKHKFYIDGYNIIQNDRTNAQRSGGPAIILNKNIQFSKITNPSSRNNSIIEYTIIQINISNKQKLIITSIYATNSSEIKKVFLDELNNLFTKLNLQDSNNFFIIAGDFNARQKPGKPETQFTESYNNQSLYEAAKIPRINNFMIKLTRDYYGQLPKIDNSIIKDLAKMNTDLNRATEKGYLQPQAFIELDKLGLNDLNIPTIYHRSRHKANKAITLDTAKESENLKYSRAIPLRDSNDFHRTDSQKYWWLKEARHIKELKARKKRLEK